MKQRFKTFNFRPGTLALISTMDDILSDYADMGYVLTVRQLYYQLVARDHVPNSQRSYKRVVSIASDGRLAGLLDWSHIEDRARGVMYPGHWTSPVGIVGAAYESFRVNRWINQPNHVIVMVEKDALTGVLEPVCNEMDVRLYPNKGYASLSMMYRHGLRWRVENIKEKDVHIIYLGDHDPSGMDMDRDLQERGMMFTRGKPFTFKRIALTMGQIEEHDPPPQWAKASDSRSPGYVAQYGDDVWELDALEPGVLAELTKQAIENLRDQDLYDEIMEVETGMRDDLEQYVDSYEEQLANGDLDHYIPDWYKELAGIEEAE